MNCVQHFFNAAEDFPNHLAIVTEENSISYAELKIEVIATARYFESKGIQPGDRVLVFVPMSVDLYRVVLALFSMGATAVFLDEWVSKKRMELCCEIAQCKGFIGITKAHIVRLFSKELRKIPVRLKLKGRVHSKDEFSLFQPNLEAAALITFTTGSTGTPKAANRTHDFLLAQFEAIKAKINPKPTDVVMPVLPIVLFINLGVGSTSVIYRYKSTKLHTIQPRKVADLIEKYQVNQLISSPSFVYTLANHVLETGEPMASLKTIYTGGAPVFPNEARIYSEAFPDTLVEIIYGSTEAEPISAVSIHDLIESDGKQKGLLVGFPDPSAEVKIIPFRDEVIELNENEQLMSLNAGEIGEIVVAGNHVLTAYFNNPAALKRAKIWENNKVYHRTGDSGFINEDGRLFLVGRSTHIIEIDGEKIYPFLFEYDIQQIEGIHRGTIVQQDKENVMIVELKSNANRETVLTALKARFNFPFKTIFTKIPLDKRHHGKIDHETLVQDYCRSNMR